MKLSKTSLFLKITISFLISGLFFCIPHLPSLEFGINRLYISEASPKIIIDNNWTAAQSAGICTGDGTPENPYLIKDKIIDAGDIGSCIMILNAYESFYIKNCTLINSGDEFYDSGLYIEQAGNGKIEYCSISGNKYGVRMTDATNVNITRCGLESERGVHYSTNCSDMWLYLNNLVGTDYTLYFLDLNSTTYHTPSQFVYEYSGKNHSSYLGNYWIDQPHVDEDHNGITDNSVIFSNSHIYIVDEYPLMSSHSNYILHEPWFEPEPKISGYNLFILGAMIVFISMYLVKQSRKKK